MGIITFSRVLTIAVCGYMLYSLSSFYKIFHLDECKTSQKRQEHCIYPQFSSNSEYALDITGYARYASPVNKQLLLEMGNIRFNAPFSKVISLQIPWSIRRNRSKSFVIDAVVRPAVNGDYSNEMMISMELSRLTVPLATVYNLLGSNNSTPADPQSGLPEMHLYKKIVMTTLSELPVFDYHQVPQEISQLLKVSRNSSGKLVYQPIIYFNTFLLSQEDLVRVSGTNLLDTINVTIELLPVSIGKLRLWRLIEHATQDLNKLGFNEKSVDSVRGIFTNTNFYLLAVTFSVAALHLLFDVLSFKNDISFWRSAKTTRGLSGRTVMWRCASSIIVLLYLMEEDTSLLVLLPFGASMLIEFWKLARILKVTIGWSGIHVNKRDQGELDTDSFDSEGTRYLMWLVVPLCLVGAVYSLLYQPHKSWYSWTVTTLANGVYVFGFLFMTPQLFINYKLKSVAHLPWKALTYKAFNTFIDDFFAFIITMPTSHRLACFRDDIVFVVYIYQRWLYPVDKSRVNEFGQAFDKPDVTGDSDDKKIR